MNYYKIPAEQLKQNLNDVLKMTGDTFSQHDAKLPVMRRLYEEMKFELSWVEANNGDNKNYLDGYREAVRCMAVVIKQLTGVDVKNGT